MILLIWFDRTFVKIYFFTHFMVKGCFKASTVMLLSKNTFWLVWQLYSYKIVIGQFDYIIIEGCTLDSLIVLWLKDNSWKIRLCYCWMILLCHFNFTEVIGFFLANSITSWLKDASWLIQPYHDRKTLLAIQLNHCRGYFLFDLITPLLKDDFSTTLW